MKRILHMIAPVLFYICCFSAETFAQGPRAEELTRTSEVFDSADKIFEPPEQEYVDENGTVYHLDNWQTVELPDEKTEKIVEDEVIYDRMEYIDSIPQTTEISIYNEYTGEKSVSTFPVLETVCLEERWADGLKLPVTYHDYHSDAYQLGEYLITPDEERPKLEGYEGTLLAMAGLPESDYRITSIDWDGQPYQDDMGQWCRDATAYGEKRLCDYRVRYGGKTVLTKPGGIQWKAVYRPVEEPAEVFEDIVVRTEPSTIEIPAPQKPPRWKLWIKSTVIITVAIGLLLILIGLMTYAASWMKKRVKQKYVRK